jgi:hypothetical protein
MQSILMSTKSFSTRHRYAYIALGLLALLLVLHFALALKGASDAPVDSAEAAPATVEIARAQVRPVDTIVTVQGTLTASQGASAKIAPMTAMLAADCRATASGG